MSDNDTEKATEVRDTNVGTLLDLPPDPDAGLSDTEKAAIVSFIRHHAISSALNAWLICATKSRTAGFSGALTSL